MYDPQFEKLVDMALEDGVITEKEKNILVKRAKLLGIDLDEFEMYLDSRLASLSNIQNTTPSQKKFGDILKCPSCGASVPSLMIICKDCDFEFRNIKANSTVKELVDKLEQATITVVSEEITFLNILNTDCWTKVDYLKSEIVANFPVPNTKEDLLEFAIFVSSNIDSYKGINVTGNAREHRSKEKWNGVWIKKYKEIICKAKLLCKDDPSFPELIINLIKKKDIKIPSEFEKWIGGIGCLSFFVLLIFFYGLVFIYNSLSSRSPPDPPIHIFLPLLMVVFCGPFIIFVILNYKYGSKPVNWNE